jgi:alpha-galactosidase
MIRKEDSAFCLGASKKQESVCSTQRNRDFETIVALVSLSVELSKDKARFTIEVGVHRQTPAHDCTETNSSLYRSVSKEVVTKAILNTRMIVNQGRIVTPIIASSSSCALVRSGESPIESL